MQKHSDVLIYNVDAYAFIIDAAWSVFAADMDGDGVIYDKNGLAIIQETED